MSHDHKYDFEPVFPATAILDLVSAIREGNVQTGHTLCTLGCVFGELGAFLQARNAPDTPDEPAIFGQSAPQEDLSLEQSANRLESLIKENGLDKQRFGAQSEVAGRIPPEVWAMIFQIATQFLNKWLNK